MKMLVATDGSKHSYRVVEKALQYAGALNASVTLLHVIGDHLHRPPYVIHLSEEAIATLIESFKDDARKQLADLIRMFEDNKIPIESRVEMSNTSPADVICKIAREGGYQLVIVGSRGMGGLKEFFLGSVSNKVAHQIQTDVMIIK